MTTDDLVRDGLGRSLFRMTWPMIFGVLSLMTVHLVDSAFVGQLGVDPLAALGFTLPVMQLMIGMQVGIGIATTALISRALGAGDSVRAQRLGGLVIAVGLGAAFLLCGILWFSRAPLLSLLGIDSALMPLIDQYWVPWLASAWMGAALYYAYSICRAHGDTRLPGLMMVVTSFINLALDPLFIFTFGWGLPGAALATLVAFGTGAAVVYWRVWHRGWVRFDMHSLPIDRAVGQLSGIAGPAMLSQLMPPIAAMTATALVAGFGATAVAAWALGTRLEYFSIVVVLALTMSLPPMVGRFLGAGQLDHVRALVRLAVGFVLGWQLAVAVLWLVLSGVLSHLLTQDLSVAAILQDYLVRVPLSYGGLGVCMIMVSVCNALGMPLRAMLISSLRLFAWYLPALWLGAYVAGLSGLFTGALVGNLLAGTAAWLLYRRALEYQVAVAGTEVARPR
ncbi:MATE family efflux transporter [Alkalilimnicola ehrlichii]|uniref:MATE family efflux transporter n=1 Tax=Alkalilimnicola ehrlichii TaxID=351052 RepID=A0A3E0WTD0_9GAMM|nr:MATE family efflux transporter [Alkalilimnicola ehrlichii]RFA29187.1 MATE family efflux transporter [Alkalilimnicola ehrlichii]RFA36098.1 MATE family efflux transporter [Alkalilimnicola ehrlichii]